MKENELKQLLLDYLMSGNVRGYLAAVCYAYDQLNKSQALEQIASSINF